MQDTHKDAVLSHDDELAKQGAHGCPGDCVLDFGKYNGERVCDIGATREGWSYLRFLGKDMDDSRMEIKTHINEWLAATPKPMLVLSQCLDYRLPFGKFKGNTLRQLSQTLEGNSYMKYLKGWEEFNDRDVIEEVIEHHWPTLPARELDMSKRTTWTLPFGKYKGRRLATMQSKAELGYMKYMIKSISQKKGSGDHLLHQLMFHVGAR